MFIETIFGSYWIISEWIKSNEMARGSLGEGNASMGKREIYEGI